MATKKQRRRRDKDRRHEWEYVYVDGEGREVETDEAKPAQKKEKDEKARSSPRGARGGRRVDPPSWRRVVRRAAIFAPIMFIAAYLLQSKSQNRVEGALLQTVLLLVVFIPFSYFLDSMLYRSYRRRTAAGGDGKK